MVTVREIMTTALHSVGRLTNLQDAANEMSYGHIGFLPVVDENNKVVGAVTDRDLALAMGKINKSPADIKVVDIMNKTVHTVSPEESVSAALGRMRTAQVGRLPVVDPDDKLIGIVTLMSIARHVKDSPEQKEVEQGGTDNILNTFYAIAERNDHNRKERVAAM